MGNCEDETALYRLFDADGDLLYIGISHQPLTRWKQHAKEKCWWPEVAAFQVEWLPTRTAAESAEIRAIKDECPRYNGLRIDPDRPPRPPRASRRPTAEQIEEIAAMDALTARYQREEKAAEKARLSLRAWIVDNLENGPLGPSDIARHSPYELSHIQRIRKEENIPLRKSRRAPRGED